MGYLIAELARSSAVMFVLGSWAGSFVSVFALCALWSNPPAPAPERCSLCRSMLDGDATGAP